MRSVVCKEPKVFAAMLFVAVAVGACGSVSDGPLETAGTQQLTPAARCEAALAGLRPSDHAQLVAVFESSALEIAAWQESGLIPGGGHAGAGQSPLRSHPPGESIASCYFDGTITVRGPLPEGATPPVFERMLLILDGSGGLLQELGGPKKLFPLVRPAA